MTPSHLELLKFALENVNAPRSEKRMDAALAFRRLNRTYGRQEVDRVRKEMESAGIKKAGAK